MSVHRELDVIELDDLTDFRDVGNFIRAIYHAEKAGFKDLIVDFSKTETVFPNVAVPIAGLIDYYSENGFYIKEKDGSRILETMHIMNPLTIESQEDLSKINSLNRVFKFTDSNHVFWLVNSMLEELNSSDKFEKGVLEGLEWCLNEVMDNVIQHSGSDAGYVMGQIHKSSKHVAFTVFDTGQGIFNSLKDTIHNPRNPVDAITLSIQEGITRDKKIGQGNGMFGLQRIIENNNGSLRITSSSGAYYLKGDVATTHARVPFVSRNTGCAIIDFQLDYDRDVSISEALRFNGKSYELVNLKIEELENDKGEIEFRLIEKSSGFGTRQAGERLRNQILNIHQQSKQVILIDFQGVELISSSFADELLGKLVVELGFFGFNSLIRMRNMNNLTQNIVQRSVSQRMAESIE